MKSPLDRARSLVRGLGWGRVMNWPTLIRFTLIISMLVGFILLGEEEPADRAARTGPDAERLILSVDEQRFVADHPRVRIGTTPNYPPYDFVRDGQPTGYSTDYVRKLMTMIGLEAEFVVGQSWEDLLGRLCRGEIDLLHAADLSQPVLGCARISPPQIRDTRRILTRNDFKHVDSIDDLVGFTMATPRGWSQADEIRERYGSRISHLETEDVAAAIEAVRQYRADFVIASANVLRYSILKAGYESLKIEGHYLKGDRSDNLFIASRRDRPLLGELIARAMEQMPPSFLAGLRETWFGAGERQLLLSEGERGYLNENSPLDLCVHADWRPLEFINLHGEHDGIGALLSRELEGLLDTSFRARPFATLAAALQMVERGECDLVSLLDTNSEAAAGLLQSETVLSQEVVIATRPDTPYIDNLDLLTGKALGSSAASDLPRVLFERFGGGASPAHFSVGGGLLAVASGELFAYIDAVPVIAYPMQSQGIEVKISGRLDPSPLELAYGIRRDAPLLLSAIEKGLDAIDPLRRETIANRYANLTVTRTVIDYRLLWQVVAASLLVVVVIGVWSRNLHRTKEEYRQFIDTISHEYRTPLASIRTHIDVLHCKNEIQSQRYRQIMDELTRLQHLFSEALLTSRLGKPPQADLQPVEWIALLEEALDEFADRFPECPFDFVPGTAEITIEADAEQLQTAMRNLLNNAALYRHPANEESVVKVALATDHRSATLTIENPVPATLKINQRELFGRFVRGENRGRSSGMGLGLHLTQRIVASHHGQIDLALTDHATFVATLRLPCASANSVNQG
jgi:signal transduction histidine kinase